MRGSIHKALGTGGEGALPSRSRDVMGVADGRRHDSKAQGQAPSRDRIQQRHEGSSESKGKKTRGSNANRTVEAWPRTEPAEEDAKYDEAIAHRSQPAR